MGSRAPGMPLWTGPCESQKPSYIKASGPWGRGTCLRVSFSGWCQGEIKIETHPLLVGAFYPGVLSSWFVLRIPCPTSCPVFPGKGFEGPLDGARSALQTLQGAKGHKFVSPESLVYTSQCRRLGLHQRALESAEGTRQLAPKACGLYEHW